MVKVIAILCLIFLPATVHGREHPEKWYQEKWCGARGGQMEVVLPDRTRVDCLLPDYAVEVDFASKWAECAGQSLHYSRMTRRPPGCVLIIERGKDNKYSNMFMESFPWI